MFFGRKSRTRLTISFEIWTRPETGHNTVLISGVATGGNGGSVPPPPPPHVQTPPEIRENPLKSIFIYGGCTVYVL